MTAYRITNWDRLYETAETRKIKRLAWVPTRNKHDGLGFRRMAREKDSCELFTAWNLMLQIASKGEGQDRGTLTREGLPLEPDDLQMMTGFPSRIFKRGMEFFSTHNIAWLEKIRPISGEHPASSGESPDVILLNRTEGTEQKEQNTAADAADPFAEERYKEARLVVDALTVSLSSWKPDLDAISPSKINRTRKGWTDAADKMLRIDRRDLTRVLEIIQWLPSHVGNNGSSFCWRNVVLSMQKFRKQYDQLDIACTAKPLPQPWDGAV